MLSSPSDDRAISGCHEFFPASNDSTMMSVVYSRWAGEDGGAGGRRERFDYVLGKDDVWFTRSAIVRHRIERHGECAR